MAGKKCAYCHVVKMVTRQTSKGDFCAACIKSFCIKCIPQGNYVYASYAGVKGKRYCKGHSTVSLAGSKEVPPK